MYGPYDHMGGFGLLFMLFVAIFWLLVIGGIIALIVWLVRRTTATPGSNAIDILNTRYAKGEISREEYERMKREITS